MTNTFWFKIRAPAADHAVDEGCRRRVARRHRALPLPGQPGPTGLVGAQACNDNFPGLGQRSQLSFNSVAGATYYAQFGKCASNAGCGTSDGRVSFIALTNDQPANAESAGTTTRSNVGAGTDAERTTCGSAEYGATVWFRWKAPAQGHVSFVVSGRRDDVLALYAADGTYLDCNDDSGGIFRSEVTRDVRAGEELLIQMVARPSAVGPSTRTTSPTRCRSPRTSTSTRTATRSRRVPTATTPMRRSTPAPPTSRTTASTRTAPTATTSTATGIVTGARPAATTATTMTPECTRRSRDRRQLRRRELRRREDARRAQPGADDPLRQRCRERRALLRDADRQQRQQGLSRHRRLPWPRCPKTKKRRHQTKLAKKRGAVRFHPVPRPCPAPQRVRGHRHHEAGQQRLRQVRTLRGAQPDEAPPRDVPASAQLYDEEIAMRKRLTPAILAAVAVAAFAVAFAIRRGGREPARAGARPPRPRPSRRRSTSSPRRRPSPEGRRRPPCRACAESEAEAEAEHGNNTTGGNTTVATPRWQHHRWQHHRRYTANTTRGNTDGR